MDQRFSNIKVCVWDFDGTLYQPNEGLWKEIREAEYRVICDHTGWDRERAALEFNQIYKKITPSATETVAKLCEISTAQAAKGMEFYYDRRKYLKRDPKLISLFEKLKGYRHLILANGIKARLEETLDVLGLKRDLFELIVTSELTGVNKPSEIPFQYILDFTKEAAGNHLMIGDREQIDLVPAKALGMKTCLVWVEAQGTVADVTLKTVYDVEQLLV